MCPIWGWWGRLGPCAEPGGNIERNIAAYLHYLKFLSHISIAKLFTYTGYALTYAFTLTEVNTITQANTITRSVEGTKDEVEQAQRTAS